MITEHDLQEAIAECEGQRNPTANTCLKLAAFYIIQDRKFHVEQSKTEPNFYSTKASVEMNEQVERKNETEFRQAVANLDTNVVISIMDEAMETLKIISPRLYNGIISKLTQAS